MGFDSFIYFLFPIFVSMKVSNIFVSFLDANMLTLDSERSFANLTHELTETLEIHTNLADFVWH